MSRQEKNDRKQSARRDALDLRSVACAVMGIPFGAVQVPTAPYKDRAGNAVRPEGGELLLVSKEQRGVLVEQMVAVRWEMTDNPDAIVRRAA